MKVLAVVGLSFLALAFLIAPWRFAFTRGWGAQFVVLACLVDSCFLHWASSADGRTVRLEGMKPLSQS